MALPVLLAVWVYMAYAIVIWRASRGGPEPVGGPAARGHLGIQVGWIAHHDRDRAVPGRLRHLRARPARGCGRGAGPEPDLDPDVAKRPADPGDRPAMEVDLPLPDLRRIRDQPARHPRRHHHRLPRDVARRHPLLLGLPARGQGRRQPRPGQRGLHHDEQLGTFIVRCAELCGLWHGAMYNYGTVVVAAGLRDLGDDDRVTAARPTRSCCRPSPTPTSPTPTAPTAGTTPTTSTPTPTSRPTAPPSRRAVGDVRRPRSAPARITHLPRRGAEQPWPLTPTRGRRVRVPRRRSRRPATGAADRRAFGLASPAPRVGHRRRRRRLPRRPLAGQRHRQRLRRDSETAARTTSPSSWPWPSAWPAGWPVSAP